MSGDEEAKSMSCEEFRDFLLSRNLPPYQLLSYSMVILFFYLLVILFSSWSNQFALLQFGKYIDVIVWTNWQSAGDNEAEIRSSDPTAKSGFGNELRVVFDFIELLLFICSKCLCKKASGKSSFERFQLRSSITDWTGCSSTSAVSPRKWLRYKPAAG